MNLQCLTGNVSTLYTCKYGLNLAGGPMPSVTHVPKEVRENADSVDMFAAYAQQMFWGNFFIYFSNQLKYGLSI